MTFHLCFLDWTHNKIEQIPHSITRLKKLKKLYLSGDWKTTWQISDISFLEKLTNLQTLDLRSNKISDISFLEKPIQNPVLSCARHLFLPFADTKN